MSKLLGNSQYDQSSSEEELDCKLLSFLVVQNQNLCCLKKWFSVKKKKKKKKTDQENLKGQMKSKKSHNFGSLLLLFLQLVPPKAFPSKTTVDLSINMEKNPSNRKERKEIVHYFEYSEKKKEPLQHNLKQTPSYFLCNDESSVPLLS